MQLPIDAEWLEQLYDIWKDPLLVKILSKVTNDDVQSYIQKVISERVISERTDLLDTLMNEARSPHEMFRGRFIETLRINTFPFLREYTREVERIPVALLPTQELNACVMKTPRGNPVILLDSGVIFHLSMLVRSFLAYFSWHSRAPFSRDYSQASFGDTILLLGEFCSTGNVSVLSEIETYDLPSRPTYDTHVETSVRFIEKYILLHEYGHAILKHLDVDDTTLLQAAPKPLEVYSVSQQQELEADAFALDRLIDGTKGQMSPSDVAFFAGILFRFFDVCEAFRASAVQDKTSHPPALARWQRTKQRAERSHHLEDEVFGLDSAFEGIKEKRRWPPTSVI